MDTKPPSKWRFYNHNFNTNRLLQLWNHMSLLGRRLRPGLLILVVHQQPLQQQFVRGKVQDLFGRFGVRQRISSKWHLLLKMRQNERFIVFDGFLLTFCYLSKDWHFFSLLNLSRVSTLPPQRLHYQGPYALPSPSNLSKFKDPCLFSWHSFQWQYCVVRNAPYHLLPQTPKEH